jgi:hypothetical protein
MVMTREELADEILALCADLEDCFEEATPSEFMEAKIFAREILAKLEEIEE